MAAHRRHALSDEVWTLRALHLPGRPGTWGGRAKDDQQFIHAVFWICVPGRLGALCRRTLAIGRTTHRRFCRWRDAGRWEALLEKLLDEPDFEWLMIDARSLKVHPQAAGAKGGNQAMSRTQGGSTRNYIGPWMRRVCRSEWLLRQGTTADCTPAVNLMAGLSAEYLVAERGEDSDTSIEQAKGPGREPVIPPRKHRLYKLRHLVENAFLHLKLWRGIATR